MSDLYGVSSIHQLITALSKEYVYILMISVPDNELCVFHFFFWKKWRTCWTVYHFWPTVRKDKPVSMVLKYKQLYAISPPWTLSSRKLWDKFPVSLECFLSIKLCFVEMILLMITSKILYALWRRGFFFKLQCCRYQFDSQ